MSLISPERQYAINYEISREAPTAPQAEPSAAAKGKKPAEPTRKILLDDPVSLRQSLGLDPSKPRVSLQDFRAQVGQDSALLENTLRTKIAEYGLRPGTKLELARDERGEIQVLGANLPQGVLMQIAKDLNLNQEFRNAFSRLSVNQPTLDYAANVNKLSSTYGTGNSLFNSLLSNRGDNNSLLDLANRYEKLKQSYDKDPLASMLQATSDENYRFTVSA